MLFIQGLMKETQTLKCKLMYFITKLPRGSRSRTARVQYTKTSAASAIENSWLIFSWMKCFCEGFIKNQTESGTFHMVIVFPQHPFSLSVPYFPSDMPSTLPRIWQLSAFLRDSQITNLNSVSLYRPSASGRALARCQQEGHSFS